MKKLALILSLLASCSVWAQGSIEAGKAKSQTCVACHGADGNSLITQYPKLAGQHEKYLEKQLKELKLGMTSGGKQGRNEPVMGAMAMPLSEQDMADLAAYYASLPISNNSTPENVVEEGKILYTAGNAERGLTACIACHGPRGNGTELSGFPKISGQHAEYIKAQLEKFRDGSRNNDMNAMMRDVAKKLTDAEIDTLSKYVGGLH
ncbi:cytochrome c4 [Vibrio sp. IB15]|uniref:Cytochrome c4 n=1 Tax=Vibrio chagasii TaxID=170679 RepID=A0A7V7TI88_9VIBR|nr:MULTISPECIES: c-type cytochrome [Vibrio]KAB0482909.1 cytochrome c4 [Vibrio chagasii]MBJ2145933.1 cytochrome c4 [Vibrio sp. IB15]MCG9691432.1 cytochrome c4 [Vibrio sp. Isolate22]PML58926.1 cytochrome C [Vibrio sp. 10N.261.52.A1]|eukprot:TRINITY_DN1501_c0_g1_i1.p2 TRINITY_DN1501_c0_g1~~TRINITY_DN1501_c0_g1_i1.p2  ORF type:complete len:206 (-),score=8.07 TRINITY_DN1501_c0_g1_i1:496-1113(-)